MIMTAFLGNTGRQYEKTRHNLPWMILEKISFFYSLRWISKFKAEYAQHSGGLILLKPKTLMNRSGESVGSASTFFKLDPGSLIVVHDELELPFGTVQLRKGGGTGGHNGLRSVIKATGSSDFYRFRLGISRPAGGRDVSSWVLSRFSPDEEIILDEYCRLAAEILEKSLSTLPAPGKKIKLI